MKGIFKILLWSLLAFANSGCVKSQTQVLGVIQTSGIPNLVIFSGESNSGGIGANASATGAELASQPTVQIYNNFTHAVENLLIGTNNLIGHVGLEAYVSNSHGWELELANRMRAGTFAPAPLYLDKTGQGGSVINDWRVGGGYGGKDFWQTMQNRIDSTITFIQAQTGKTPRLFLFYSQGINDIISGTDTATWRTATEAHFTKIRAKYPSIKIFMTKFNQSGYTSYNTTIDVIASRVSECYAVDPGSATYGGAHWDYAGLKVVSDALINTLLAHYSVN
jgi:hypothetical protein